MILLEVSFSDHQMFIDSALILSRELEVSNKPFIGRLSLILRDIRTQITAIDFPEEIYDNFRFSLSTEVFEYRPNDIPDNWLVVRNTFRDST